MTKMSFLPYRLNFNLWGKMLDLVDFSAVWTIF